MGTEPTKLKVWTCKIGEAPASNLPDGADAPTRSAVSEAYMQMTGQEPLFLFSGWAGELDEGERACVERREPSAEYRAEWHKREAAPVMFDALRTILGALDDPTGGEHVADMRRASAVARAAIAKATGQ